MSSRLDRLTLLTTFVRIAERGSISAAARDIGISQASASRQLAELEARLGVELIRRTTHDLVLTRPGESCLADARALLAGWEGLVERNAQEQSAVAGRIDVVAPVALGQLALADAACAFLADYPGVSVTWRLEDAPIRFAEAGCDLWLRVGTVPDETLVVRRLGRAERLVVAAPALVAGVPPGRGGPALLKTLPWISLQPYEGARVTLAASAGRTVELAFTPTLATDNVMVARHAALAGLGCALLPSWLVAEELADGRLVDVVPRWRPTAIPIHAAWMPTARQTRRLRLLTEHMTHAITGLEGVVAG